MEILLLSDIPGIGKKNDLLIVGDGYALNYLLPARKALVVTPNVRRRYAEKIKERALEREREKTLQTSAISAIKDRRLSLAAAATKTGKLYAGITRSSIVKAMKEQLGIALQESSVALAEPIKTAGTHTVAIQAGGQSASLTIEVKAETKAKRKAE